MPGTVVEELYLDHLGVSLSFLLRTTRTTCRLAGCQSARVFGLLPLFTNETRRYLIPGTRYLFSTTLSEETSGPFFHMNTQTVFTITDSGVQVVNKKIGNALEKSTIFYFNEWRRS